MARQRKHEELQGLFGSDLEFLIVELTVGALAYRNRDILRDTIIDGYSERMSYENSMRRGSYADGGSMRGSYRGSYDEGPMRGSYARGRGRNARRDSMGRYSSGNEMMMEQLQDLMEESPDCYTAGNSETYV